MRFRVRGLEALGVYSIDTELSVNISSIRMP